MSAAQEVRTVFTWDTADVDKGVQRMERSMDRLNQSQKKSADQSRSASHGGGGSNFAMGLRDLMEGRGVNAVQRFGHAIGATATRLALYMGAVKAAGAATHYLVDEINKYDANSRQLETSFVTSNRASTFANAGQSPNELAALRKQNTEGLTAENEQQGGLQTAAGMLNAMKNGNALSSAFAKAIETVNAFQGKRSPEEEIAASQGRAAVYSKESKRLGGLYSSSVQSQTEQARLNAPGEYNDPFEAKRRELELQEKVETSNARAANATKEDLQAIKERYEYLRKSVDAESNLAGVRFENARKLLEIEGGPGSSFRKGLAGSNERLQQSQTLLKSGDLNLEQQRAERLKVQHEQNAQRDAIMGRYLNADGTARRPADIQRDFLRDSAETRARARFQRRYAAGGYDPVTGRRRATGDRPGSGLHSGGLTSGHITGGSNAEWDHPFPHYRAPVPRSPLEIGPLKHFTDLVHPKMTNTIAPGGGGGGGKTIGDLHTLLEQRLPKATAN